MAGAEIGEIEEVNRALVVVNDGSVKNCTYPEVTQVYAATSGAKARFLESVDLVEEAASGD